jgi:hypothetical protein
LRTSFCAQRPKLTFERGLDERLALLALELGKPPITPAGVCAFCSRMALAMSSGYNAKVLAELLNAKSRERSIRS